MRHVKDGKRKKRVLEGRSHIKRRFGEIYMDLKSLFVTWSTLSRWRQTLLG